MIYLYNHYTNNKYWSSPFNNILNALYILFNQNNVKCSYLNDNISGKNDIIIVISGIINDKFPLQNIDGKFIIINSESISLTGKIKKEH